MKSTKIMLALVATFLATWMFLSLIGYLCVADMSFRDVATSGPICFLLLIFGWIPSIIVGMDMDEHLSKKYHQRYL